MALNLDDEPAGVLGSLNTALVSTIGIGSFCGIDPKIIGATCIAVGAWIGFAASIVRARVTPTKQVEVTVDQANAIRLGQQHPAG